MVLTWRFSSLCIHHTYIQYKYNTALYAYIKRIYLFIYLPIYLFIYLCIDPHWKLLHPRCSRSGYRAVKSLSLVPVLRQTNLDHVLALLDPSSYYRPFWIQVSKVIFFTSRRSTEIFLCISRYLPACNIPSRGITVLVTTMYGRPSKV